MMNWPRGETAMRKGLLILALVAAAGPAPAQDYPTRPIKALTTTSAGGISDVFMRALGDELLKRWGQHIVVENRPGGMQNVGAKRPPTAIPSASSLPSRSRTTSFCSRAYRSIRKRACSRSPTSTI